MKKVLLLSVLAVCFEVCQAQEVLGEYDWSKPASAGDRPGGVPATVDGKASLKVVNTNDTPLQVHLLKIVHPEISKVMYAIEGEVKYEDVQGDACLEMWSYFPAAQPGAPEMGYFSRTLARSGEMGRITGSSEWRRFMLPFDRRGTSSAPTRLEINLLLPGRGTVILSAVKLEQYDRGFQAARAGAADAWWPERAGGVIGGATGGFLGCFASFLAALATKGKARGFVLASLKAMIGLGLLSTAVGLVALGLRQPVGVWCVLLLLGAILLAIVPARLKHFHRGYEEVEMRKMAAIDA